MALAQEKEIVTHLELKDLSPAHLNKDFDSAQQISTHLRRQLEQCGIGKPRTIVIPSTMELSYFYGRSVLDVLDALFELRKQQYEYQMFGLDGEILLWDPVNRKPKQRRQAQHFHRN